MNRERRDRLRFSRGAALLRSFLYPRPSLQRTAKFALVGAIGIVVQLAVLEALTALGCNYMWATGLAVEAAVLNNFVWHQSFTWRDRGDSRLEQTAARLFRFHLSNGAISILGSLLLMRCLVGSLGMSVLVANLLTIVACSIGNSLASDRWVFLSPVRAAASPGSADARTPSTNVPLGGHGFSRAERATENVGFSL
jgi:putative flippase GtrA